MTGWLDTFTQDKTEIILNYSYNNVQNVTLLDLQVSFLLSLLVVGKHGLKRGVSSQLTAPQRPLCVFHNRWYDEGFLSPYIKTARTNGFILELNDGIE